MGKSNGNGVVCGAIASRNGGTRCRQPATVDADGDGVNDSCYLPKHQAQMLNVARPPYGKETARAGTNSAHSAAPALEPAPPPPLEGRQVLEVPAPAPPPPPVTPPPPPLEVDAAVAELLSSLPAAPGDDADEIARIVAAPPPADLEETEAHASDALGDVPEDLEEAEEYGARRAARGSVRELRNWSHARLERYMRLVINHKLVKDGKEPLDKEELQEGAEIAAEILGDAANLAERNKWVAFALWGIAVTVPRYMDEVSGFVRKVVELVVRIMFPNRRPLEAPAPAHTVKPPEVNSNWGHLN